MQNTFVITKLTFIAIKKLGLCETVLLYIIFSLQDGSIVSKTLVIIRGTWSYKPENKNMKSSGADPIEM